MAAPYGEKARYRQKDAWIRTGLGKSQGKEKFLRSPYHNAHNDSGSFHWKVRKQVSLGCAEIDSAYGLEERIGGPIAIGHRAYGKEYATDGGIGRIWRSVENTRSKGGYTKGERSL